jgi:hypothetical protein
MSPQVRSCHRNQQDLVLVTNILLVLVTDRPPTEGHATSPHVISLSSALTRQAGY